MMCTSKVEQKNNLSVKEFGIELDSFRKRNGIKKL